jgi:hypothetical protein
METHEAMQQLQHEAVQQLQLVAAAPVEANSVTQHLQTLRVLAPTPASLSERRSVTRYQRPATPCTQSGVIESWKSCKQRERDRETERGREKESQKERQTESLALTQGILDLNAHLSKHPVSAPAATSATLQALTQGILDFNAHLLLANNMKKDYESHSRENAKMKREYEREVADAHTRAKDLGRELIKILNAQEQGQIRRMLEEEETAASASASALTSVLTSFMAQVIRLKIKSQT